MSATSSVLFVCLGNICRSPTAEATFAHAVRERGLSHLFHIDSCGTGGWHAGELAHADTRRVAKARGVEITHRARQLTDADFTRFDHLLAMDESNLRGLLERAPLSARHKLALFRDHDPLRRADERLEVPDPYYTGEFERVFEICDRTSRTLLSRLLQPAD